MRRPEPAALRRADSHRPDQALLVDGRLPAQRDPHEPAIGHVSNRFADDEAALAISTPDYSALEKGQVKSVKKVRQKRSAADVERALAALRDASAPASTNPRLMPLIIDAVRARATVGEIAETLAANWGFYRP